MANSLSSCPNCGTAWLPGAEACPHCGYLRPNDSAWPPPPSGLVSAPSVPPVPKLVTGKVWGDLALGIGLSFLSNFLFCAGFVLMPILYFTLKPQSPVFARGIGYGFLAGVVVLLGALGVCIVGLQNYHGG